MYVKLTQNFERHNFFLRTGVINKVLKEGILRKRVGTQVERFVWKVNLMKNDFVEKNHKHTKAEL